MNVTSRSHQHVIDHGYFLGPKLPWRRTRASRWRKTRPGPVETPNFRFSGYSQPLTLARLRKKGKRGRSKAGKRKPQRRSRGPRLPGPHVCGEWSGLRGCFGRASLPARCWSRRVSEVEASPCHPPGGFLWPSLLWEFGDWRDPGDKGECTTRVPTTLPRECWVNFYYLQPLKSGSGLVLFQPFYCMFDTHSAPGQGQLPSLQSECTVASGKRWKETNWVPR